MQRRGVAAEAATPSTRKPAANRPSRSVGGMNMAAAAAEPAVNNQRVSLIKKVKPPASNRANSGKPSAATNSKVPLKHAWQEARVINYETKLAERGFHFVKIPDSGEKLMTLDGEQLPSMSNEEYGAVGNLVAGYI